MSPISERRHLKYLSFAGLLWLVLAASGVMVSRLEFGESSSLEGMKTLEVYLALSPLPGILHSLSLVNALRVALTSKARIVFVTAAACCSVGTTWITLLSFGILVAVTRVKFLGLLPFTFVAGFVGAYLYYRLIKRLLLPNLPSKKALPTALAASLCALGAFGPTPIAITIIPIVWWYAFSLGLLVSSRSRRPASSSRRRWRRVKVAA